MSSPLFGRKNTNSPQTPAKKQRSLALESLECRRLLAADGLAPEVPNPGDLLFAGGFVTGTKWEDVNGNGRREPNEPGLGGVTIYADINGNRRFDSTDWSTITERSGHYEMLAPVGTYTIREVSPSGFHQTFPPTIVAGDPVDPIVRPPLQDIIVEPSFLQLDVEPGDVVEQVVSITFNPVCIRAWEFDIVTLQNDEFDVPGAEVINHSGVQINGCGGDISEFKLEIIVHDPEINDFDIGFIDRFGEDVIARIPVSLRGGSSADGHRVTIEPGTRVVGIDFGNQRNGPRPGGIEGRKWFDRNGDGAQDPNEPGLGGVEIYLDINGNGKQERHEPRTRTLYEDPDTDFEEAGRYSFEVKPGNYTVREVVPPGFEQTFPGVDASVVSSETGRFAAGSAFDFDVTSVKFAQSENTSKTGVELTVEWSNGCGEIIAGQTAHTLIGNTIVVDMHGRQTGEICIAVITPQSQTITLEGLQQGIYNVVGTLHETTTQGERATLGVVGRIKLGPHGGHRVSVASGGIVAGVDFGNRGPLGTVYGTKWHDLNADGSRQSNEPGLANVTIYADLNNNGKLDEGEPSTKSTGDDSATRGDESGNYRLSGLFPGIHTIREVVPDGFQQTFPPLIIFDPIPLPTGPDGVPFYFPPLEEAFPTGGAHRVTLRPGLDVKGIHFGNQSTEPGSIHGLKWADLNGNGRQDRDEPGLAGVTIYVDSNFNGRPDAEEPSAVTMEDDPTTTNVVETGNYWIKDVKPGNYAVREIVPDGYRQTFPGNGFWGFPPFPVDVDIVEDSLLAWPPIADFPRFAPEFPNHHFVNVEPGQTVEQINFGNQKVEPGSIHGIKWLDENGNGKRDSNERGLPGVTIYVDSNFNGRHDVGEPSAVSMSNDPTTTDLDESGMYWIENVRPGNNWVREVVPDGYQQTFPRTGIIFDRPIPLFDPDAEIADIAPFDPLVPFFPGSHFVQLGSGQTVKGIDFGNQQIKPGSIHGVKWLDENGNGKRDPLEKGLAGVTIYLDTNFSRTFDVGEPFAISMKDDPTTSDTDETGMYWINDVKPGSYHVRETIPDGFEQTFPSDFGRAFPAGDRLVIADPFPFPNGQHVVFVQAGATVGNINFGNRPIRRPGTVMGMKWIDANGNGKRDADERGLAGVTIFSDVNQNGVLDPGEPRAVTQNDDPNTPLDETGRYAMLVYPGSNLILEVRPPGMEQTFPNPLRELVHPFNLGHSISVDEAGTLGNVDFGNRRNTELQSSISGVTWLDTNANGIQDRGEELAGGITVYVDRNNNGRLDANETSTVSQDNFSLAPPLPGKGNYVLPVEPGRHTVRQVVPRGSIQTYPEGGFIFEETFPRDVPGGTAISFDLINISGTSTSPNDDGSRDVILKFQSIFGVGGYSIFESDVSVGRSEIYVELVAFPTDSHDAPVVFTDINVGPLQLGGYGVVAKLLESIPTIDDLVESFEVEAKFAFQGDDAHRVSVGAGQSLTGFNFGHIPVPAPSEGEVGAGTREPNAKLVGDLNRDGQVKFDDFLKLAANFGKKVDAVFADGDTDENGAVNFLDFLALAANFGGR